MASSPKSQIKAAIDECLAQAKHNHYLDTNDIARMMDVDVWVLYKWVEKSRIPVEEIPSFEKACGCNALTKCMAAISGYLTVPAPTGGASVAKTSAVVHLHVASAMFEALESEADATRCKSAVKLISQAIESLAWLRHQISVNGDKNA